MWVFFSETRCIYAYLASVVCVSWQWPNEMNQAKTDPS